MGEVSSRYIHGTDPEEQRRLSRLNDLLNDACLAELALHGGEKILDVGCGLGQFTRAMARAAGSAGRVLGIERSAEQLAQARRLAQEAGKDERIELRSGDALELPLSATEWGSFDLAHARFLLEHVPDPSAVVRAMVRAVRPSGRVVLVDDDHEVLRLWPEPAGFAALWQAYIRSYIHLGNDPHVGRRLVELLHQAGAIPARNRWLWFGSCAGEASLAAKLDNLIKIVTEARETILTAELLDARRFDDSLHTLEAWGRRPDAAFWFAFSWAEGRRPESPAS